MGLRDAGGNDTSHRVAQVAKLLLSGWDPRVIARTVGCSNAQAWEDIQRLRAGWLEDAKADFAAHRATEIARVDMFMAAALARGDLKLAVKCAELRCKLLGLLGPKVAVVTPTVQIPWDEIAGAMKAVPPDVIEERLAEASIPHLEARLDGHRSREDAGAGADVGGR
jgi:hypothetical protein